MRRFVVRALLPLALLVTACNSSPAIPEEPSQLQTLASGLPWPVIRNGSSGRDVVTAQYLLRARGYGVSADGAFGSGTESAVRSFQTAQGLVSDGVVGANTWEKLILTVQNGSSGDAVRAVQDQLRNRFGYSVTVDGVFGGGTKVNTQNFQRSRDLTDDGIVNLNTWSALVSNKSAVKLSDSTARTRLNNAGISVVSSGNCSDRNVSTCTSLEQVRASSIRGIIAFKNVSGCSFSVTGGTEVGHSSGTYSHYNGYKIDISRTTCVTNYIKNNYTFIGNRGDGAPQYKDGRGDIYADEYFAAHWDILFY
jgi:peptidoglycan hydrolase-like protein with peptidoglycan-binding domain